MKVEDLLGMKLFDLYDIAADFYHNHVPTNLSKDVRIIKKKSNYLGIQEVVFDRDGSGDIYVRFHRWNSVKRTPGITSFADPDLQFWVRFTRHENPVVHYHTRFSSVTCSTSWDSCLQEVINGIIYYGRSLQNNRFPPV